MSRTRPVRTSPVKLYLEWAANKKHGKISFWDRSEKKNKYLKGLKFVVLDERSSVGGFNEERNGGIRGTEVKNTKSEKMRVWIGKSKKPIEGYYQDLKSQISGLKYAKVLYIGVIGNNGGMEISKLTLVGASNVAWMNFLQGQENYKGNGKVNLLTHGVSITGRVSKKKGDNNYFEPLFETFELNKEQGDLADKLDIELQEYFDGVGDQEDGKNTTASTQSTGGYEEGVQEDEEDDYPADEEDVVEDAEDLEELPF